MLNIIFKKVGLENKENKKKEEIDHIFINTTKRNEKNGTKKRKKF